MHNNYVSHRYSMMGCNIRSCSAFLEAIVYWYYGL